MLTYCTTLTIFVLILTTLTYSAATLLILAFLSSIAPTPSALVALATPTIIAILATIITVLAYTLATLTAFAFRSSLRFLLLLQFSLILRLRL
jgi:hypothetical protein